MWSETNVLPPNLKSNPKLSSWVRIDPAGHVAISPGKVEIGQGIMTALVQIAADELDVSIARIRVTPASTAESPNEGVTSGSLSVQDSGAAMAVACAEIRALFIAAASEQLGISAEELSVDDGAIRGPGNAQTSYWALAESVDLDREATASAPLKESSARRVIGLDIGRIDIPGKVFGIRPFIHDVTFPEMLFGRIVRPDAAQAELVGLDEESVAAVPGLVRVVRDGNFLGVLAQSEEAANACHAQLSRGARWKVTESLPDEQDLANWLKSSPIETSLIDKRGAAQGLAVARTISREYSRPFIAHASIAPSVALAQWDGDLVRVWTHSQGVFNLRADLAIILGKPPADIIVEHMEGAGCYGHNGADDVALDAVLLARAAGGRPVRLQWSRQDELARSPFGAAMAVRVEADLDEANRILGWRHDIWSNGHVARPGRTKQPTLRAATEIAEGWEPYVAIDPPQAGGGGADRNSIPLYDFPAWDIVSHRLLTMPIRTSSLRSLGAFANVFAIESFMDEMAAELLEDPVAFRLRHLSDERARAVLEAAASRAGWHVRSRAEGAGLGIALARYKGTGAYCAVVAEVEAEEDVRVKRLVIAVDVGDVVNPDGVRNQIEGGAVQATSWTLKEAVRFDRTRILSEDWESYPILRFSEVPATIVEIIDRPDEKPLGAGECAHGPTAGAIANAVHDALGLRVRNLPINRDNIIKAMELSQ
jgi:nicotinate dehydrogenase subunit B